MDSWSYGSEGKGLPFTDETDLPVDALARPRKSQLGCDIKPSTDFEAVESMNSMDFVFSYMNKKPFYGNTSLGIFGAEFANDSAKRLVSPTCILTSSSSYGEECLMESNSQESSSLIDLKLGRLSDFRDAQVVCPTLTAKKARTTRSPCCQVYGCNKDLSYSKGYHKRHKVCEVHSKTPKVIVNGIEQRFCQQCSRFHLLAEFDDVKRSCRKRLAGHNERRRRLHLDTLPGKSSTKSLGNSMVKRAPLVIPKVIQCESEEKAIYSPQSKIPITNEHGIEGTFSSATEAFNDRTITSSRVEDELYGVSHSDCALSLLSAQSQHLSSHAHSYGMMNHVGVGREGSIGVSGSGHAVNFEAQTYGYLQDSGPLSTRYCLSPENGTSVDLLQLSTYLQRVERQRNSIQVKHENEDL